MTASFDQYRVDLERTVDRLRSMGIARLAASFEPEETRAQAARALIARLADAGAEIEGRAPRAVPTLNDAALGDQLAVIGRDLIVALEDSAIATADRVALADQLTAELVEFRRRI
ncbi:MAG: hypothetical protein WCI29_13685 [Actinomycetes bacterium]